MGYVHSAYAQTYPLQVTTQLAPPYSVKLSDYTSATTDRIAFNVFADISRPNLQVRFRLKIEGQNVTITTRPEYNPPPVTIQGGVPERFTGYDLMEYFNPTNLNFQGITRQQFMKTGSLPEGFYRFQLEVLEYNRGVQISNTGTANAWLILNDPPIVNLPRRDEKLKPQSPQNVLIQWTPRHTGSPNSAFTTEYEVTMVEVWPATRNPNDAILSSPPIFQATTQSTTLVYGAAETPLELGRRYAFRVQAKSMVGVEEMDLFKNKWYSEVVSFVYGDACDLPTGIRAESLNHTRFDVYWDGNFNHTAYKVRYRLAGDNTAQWYENNTVVNESSISSLKPNTTYEYQVAAVCGLFDGPYSTITTVTTKEAPPVEYSCGLPMEVFSLDPASLATSLKVGDVIQAGDFNVELVKVSGSNGVFSGEGVMRVSFLKKAMVKAEFTNITVSKELRMVNGAMNITGAAVEVVPQGLKDAMDKLDEALDAIDSTLTNIEENLPESFDPNSFVADTLIKVKDGISDVYKDADGTVVIVDKNGNKQQVPAGTSAAVTDDDGNGYLVDKKGNIHKTTADIATKAANREYNLLLKFASNDNANYGFDVKKHESLTGYETLDNGYKVAWKSVASNGTDVVTAKLTGVTDMDTRKIHFEMGGVTLQASPAISNDQSTNVTLTGKVDGMEEGLIAVYAASDTGKVQVLGKVNVVTYDEIQKTVVIVPVNGTEYPYSIATLRDSLNRIYGQAVVKWSVESVYGVDGVSIGNPFDDGETGLLSNYTSDMRKVINAYKDDMDDDKVYLFLIGGSSKNSKSLAGYMPRSKQAGFIFVDQAGNEKQLVRAIAHELGHGAFNLAHTFKEARFPLPEKTTDNLMDYAGGQKLYKFQWDKMRYPDIVIGMFEEDEDAQSITATLSSKLSINNKGEYFAYLTPAGTRIILPKDKYPIFYHGIENNEYNDVIPGSLIGFRDKPEEGKPTFSGKAHFANLSGGTFKGYTDFEYHKPEIASDDNSVVIGLPSVRKDYNYAIYKFHVSELKDFSGQSAPILSVASSEFENLGLFRSKQPDAESTSYRSHVGLVGEDQTQISEFEQEMIRGRFVDLDLPGVTSALKQFLRVPHDEKPEVFLIVKLAEYQNRYPVIFKEYSPWFDTWNVLAASKKLALIAGLVLSPEDVDALFKQYGEGAIWEAENMTPGKIDDERSEYNKWRNNLVDHTPSLYDFYRKFLNGLQEHTLKAAKENIECLKHLNDKTSDVDIFNCVVRASQDELEKDGVLSDDNRLYAIKSLLRRSWVDGETEKAIVKLIKYTPPAFKADNFLTSLENDCKVIVNTQVDNEYVNAYETQNQTICLWELLFTRVDDGNFLFSGDNRNALMLALLKQYYRSEKFKTQMADYKASLEKFELDYIGKRQYGFQYDYQGIFRRLWTNIKEVKSGMYLPSTDPADYYVSITTTIQNTETNEQPSTIKVEQTIKEGLASSTTIGSETLSPFDLTIFTNRSNQDLLRDFSQKDKDGKLVAIPVPALMLHYASVVGDNQTTGQLIQTGIDIGTLLIPGTQLAHLSKLGKVLYYADKISSVASMAGTAFEVENPEVSRIFNLASIATGVASLGELTQASKVGSVRKTDNILSYTPEQIVANSVNLADEVNTLKGTEKLHGLTLRQAEGLRTILDKDQQLLSQMGRLDEGQKLKIKNAVSVLGDVISKKAVLSASHLTDDVLALGDDLTHAVEWLGKNGNDGFFDVIIHAGDGNTFSILMEGGQSVTMTATELAQRLQGVDAAKTIRLLSCNDAESALELSKILNRDVVGSVGEMKLYDNGFIETGSWYKAKPNGVLDEYPLIPTRDPLLKPGNQSIVLGKSRRMSGKLAQEVKDELLRIFGNQAKYDEFMQHIDRLPATMTIKKMANGVCELVDKKGTSWAKIFSDRIEAVGGTGNGWNKLLNIDPPLLTKFKYIVDDNFIFETDKLGRVSKITIKDVRVRPRVRNESAQAYAKVVKDGKATDAGGHMAKAEWYGPSEQINYFPQDMASNSYGEWYAMEKQVTKLRLEYPDGAAIIKVEIYPFFEGSTKRPTLFNAMITVDDELQASFVIENP